MLPGGEEAGSVGMGAWMRERGPALDPEHTLVVNLDAVGSGEQLVVTRREGLTGRMGGDGARLAVRGAQRAGLPPPREVTLVNTSDAFVARRAGLPTVSILSYDRGWIANLHRPADTVDNVGWSTVEDAVTLTEAMLDEWLARPRR
jgi:hypothetical protein